MNYKKLSIFFFIILTLHATSQSVVITGDNTICIGQSTALHAETIGISAGTTSYTFEFIDFSTHPDFSGGTAIDPDFIDCNANYDDCWAGGTPPDHGGYDIGFTFCFFNQHYTKFYVGSNGWIGFTDPTDHSWTTYTATPIPNPDPYVPKNCIFAPWQDWYPGYIDADTIVFYYTAGTAPDRKLVVYWRSCPLYKCRTNDTIRGNFMIVLNEGTGVIENFIQDKPNCPNITDEGATQGVHNIDGTIAFTATGRNYGIWEAFNEGTRFVPSGLIWYKDVYPGGPIVGYGPDVTFSPNATTQYFAVVGTCDGADAIGSITVTVNPLPSLNINDFFPTCLNTAEFQLTGGSPSGGSYSGTGVSPTGSFNPLVAGVGIHTITYTYTEPSTGCTNSISKSLTVNPLPNVVPAAPSPLTICSGANAQVALSSNIPGTETTTTFAWTASGNSAAITPVPSSISGSDDILQNLANSGNILEPVVFHILPTASGCSPASPSDFTFNVNPIPVVSSSPGTRQVICSATATQPITLQTNVTGLSPTYNWTTVCDPGITNGPPAGGTDNPIASFAPGNSTTSQKSIVYTLAASLDASSGSCSGPTSGYTILVNPRPNVTNPVLSQVICSGLQSAPVVLLSDIPGTAFSWVSSASPGITGNTPSGNGDLPTETLFNGTTSQGSATYTITPSFSQDGVSCTGPTKDYTILVDALPVSTFTGNTTVCQLHPDAYLYPANSGPACSYTWSANPSSFGSIANATVSPASITWNTTGTATLRLDAVTPFGCASFSSQPITINPRPDVSITPCFDLVTNRSAKRFLLKGGVPLLTVTPLQGEYLINPPTVALVFESGNYYFDPALIQSNQTNTYTISYKYTSSQFGCPAVSPASLTLTVRGPNPDCSYSMTDYRDNTTYRTSFAGGKCWMMENLRYGNSLTPVTASQTDNCVVEKYCLPQDENCTSYGGFYQWNELIQYGVTASPGYQGVCPPGWHIPSAADFQALIDANKGNALSGTVLTDLNLIPRGFEALLMGMAYYNVAWVFTSTEALSGTLFWTSTPGSGNKIVARGMNSKNQSVSMYETSKVNAFPIRCIKD